MSANDEEAASAAKLAIMPEEIEQQSKPDTAAKAKAEPQKLRLFISYASEDVKIAEAVADAFKHALGTQHVDIHLDRWFLHAGDDFKLEIERKLDLTDFLIVVFTGQDKQSHGYTGWELGYFTAVMKLRPHAKIVPMYLKTPPDIMKGVLGFNIGFGDDLLDLLPAKFKKRNKVSPKEQICSFIMTLQNQVKVLAAKADRPVPKMKSPLACVREMRTDIFTALRTRPKKEIRPQKQIVFVMTDAAFKSHRPDLPPDAELRPTGDGSPMQIFGMGSSKTTWREFQNSIADKPQADSWQRAITTVIDSSFPENVNVDNSQIIVADDGKSYRIILTAGISYFDRREFSLAFVDTLKPRELGNEATSRLLKGLAIVCRFRFMFLEEKSNFSAAAIRMTSLPDLPKRARELLHELDLLGRDAAEARLDKANDWRPFIDWRRLMALTQAYEPREAAMRALAGCILRTRNARALETLRKSLARAISGIESATQNENAHFVREMASQLQAQVDTAPAFGPRGTGGHRLQKARPARRQATPRPKAARRAPAAKRHAPIRRRSA